MTHLRPVALAVALGLTIPATALADRAPNADERQRIEAALTADGFARWGEIEFDDDGYWEVDDVYDGSGAEFDVYLDPAFTITRRERD